VSEKLQGEIWLSTEDESPVALEHVRLLQAIEQSGSISAAARVLGISYKTAWERLERLNNLSSHPLLESTAGGNQGGGSELTAYGRKILRGYFELKQEHSEFISKLGAKIQHLDDLSSFVKTHRIATTAGNQFLGIVESVSIGAVNAEIIIKISDDFQLVAIVTEQSRLDLQIHAGKSILALIKSTSVLLSQDPAIAVSARNKVVGTVTRIERGKVNADVFLDLGGGKTLNAMVTETSLEHLALQPGQKICAFFKASSVILMAV
jgi:molybdate transport system regulatory protein